MVVGRRLPFLLGFVNFSGTFAVKLREGKSPIITSLQEQLLHRHLATAQFLRNHRGLTAPVATWILHGYPNDEGFWKNGIPVQTYRAFFVGMLKNFGGCTVFFSWKFFTLRPNKNVPYRKFQGTRWIPLFLVPETFGGSNQPISPKKAASLFFRSSPFQKTECWPMIPMTPRIWRSRSMRATSLMQLGNLELF